MTASAGMSARCSRSRDDRWPALGQHAQQRGRGLAGRGIPQVHHQIGRVDVGGEIGERHPPRDDASLEEPEPGEDALDRIAARLRTQQQSDAGQVRARARDGSRERLDPLLGREEPEGSDDELVGGDAVTRAQRGHFRRRDGCTLGGKRDSSNLHARDLGVQGPGHEVVVHGGQARGLDRDSEERIGIRQKRAHRGQVGGRQPAGLSRVVVGDLVLRSGRWPVAPRSVASRWTDRSVGDACGASRNIRARE